MQNPHEASHSAQRPDCELVEADPLSLAELPLPD